MPRGGPRTSATKKIGRPKGSPDKLQIRLRNVIKLGDLTPLQVMQSTMMHAYERFQAAKTQLATVKENDAERYHALNTELKENLTLAQRCAADAAPYLHAKLQSVGFDPNKPLTGKVVFSWEE
jgi:hypothetical protein